MTDLLRCNLIAPKPSRHFVKGTVMFRYLSLQEEVAKCRKALWRAKNDFRAPGRSKFLAFNRKLIIFCCFLYDMEIHPYVFPFNP